MINENEFWKLIIRNLKNLISVKEKFELKEKIKHSDEDKLLLDEVNEIWKNAEFNDYEIHDDKEKAWSKLSTEIETTQKTIFKKHAYFSIKVVASLILLIGLGLLINQFVLNKSQNVILLSNRDSVKYIVLPDNSEIWLNSNSKVNYTETFVKNRTINLEGEAFFKVQPDSSNPFIIQLAQTEVKVLGTSFNIKAYPYDSVVVVSVKSGKVAFSSLLFNKKSTLLLANEVVSFNLNKNSISKSVVRNQNYTTWLTGKISFSNSSLFEIIGFLNDNYDENIIIKDKELEDILINVSFDNQSTIQILEVLKRIVDFEYLNSGDAILIYKNKSL